VAGERAGVRLHANVAANQQAETDEQHQREDELGDDQHTAHARSWRSAVQGRCRLTEAAAHVDPGRLHRWREAGEEPGYQREKQTECEYARVPGDGRSIWHVAG